MKGAAVVGASVVVVVVGSVGRLRFLLVRNPSIRRYIYQTRSHRSKKCCIATSRDQTRRLQGMSNATEKRLS